MHQQTAVPSDPAPSAAADRRSGFILASAAVVMVAFMAVHPTVHAHDPAGFAAEMASISVLNAVVHGTLIAVLGVLVLGLFGLADRLGPRLLPVRAGLMAYGFGAVALAFAAIINGFVVPAFVARYAGDAVGAAAEWRPSLYLCHEANGVLSRIGVVAWSGAVLVWSAVLARGGRAPRPLAILGALCALAPVALLAAGRLPMNVHGFGAFILAQGIWTLAVGVQLIRARL